MIGPTNARGGGGGLNLKVVGGTTRPTNPRENTIWVNTTTAITGYVLSPTQPETGTEGLVWLKTADSGVEINVGRKNAVLLHLRKANIYVSGVWKNVDGYLYSSGSWKQFSKVTETLYKSGEFGAIPHATFVSNGTITYKDTYIVAKTKEKAKSETYVQFGPMSLDSFGSVMMRANKVTKGTGGANIFFAVLASKSKTAKRSSAEFITEVRIDHPDIDEHTISLDVSNATGDGWYISVGINTQGGTWSGSRTANIHEVSAE